MSKSRIKRLEHTITDLATAHNEIDRLTHELEACTEGPGGCGYWREAAKQRETEIDRLSDEKGRLIAENRILHDMRRVAEAKNDALVKQLVAIHSVMHTKNVVLPDGQEFKFTPPDDLVRHAWEQLSAAIRAIEDDIQANTVSTRQTHSFIPYDKFPNTCRICNHLMSHPDHEQSNQR